MWLNLNCLCAIYVCRNQRAFLAQMTSFVMRYDVIYHFFPINSQYLMTWGVDSPACGSVIFFNVAVEPRSMDTSLILTPLYNGHFHLSPRKAHLFSLKLTHFKRQRLIIETTNTFLCPKSLTLMYCQRAPLLYRHWLGICTLFQSRSILLQLLTLYSV